MQKVALPALMLAFCASGTALAQKAPTVYGKINVSVERHQPELSDYDDTLSVAALEEETQERWQVDSNASRLGVKGAFDLDVAGLEAIYQLEYEIAVDDGSASGDSPFKQRDIFGGLRGDWGTLKVGRFNTPLKQAQGKVDQFNDIDGDIKFILRGETRSSNILQYSSPELFGLLTVNAAIMPAENDDLDGDVDAKSTNDNGLSEKQSVALVFKQGSVYAAVAHDNDNDDKNLLIDSVAADSSVNPDDVAPLDIMRYVLAWRGEALELGLLHQVAEEDRDGRTMAGSVKGGEETSTVMSAAFKVDRFKFKAQYGRTETSRLYKLDGANNPRLLDGDPELTLKALGVDYQLAKASKAFLYYAKIEQDLNLTAAGVAAADNPQTVSSKSDDTTLGLGFEHKF